MNCSAEISGFLRVHAEGADFGDPYGWCCGFRADPADCRLAIIGPTERAPKRAEALAAAKRLIALGFERAQWHRHGRMEPQPPVPLHKLRAFGPAVSYDPSPSAK